MHSHIRAGRRDTLAIRRPEHCINGSLVPLVAKDDLMTSDLPDIDIAITITRGNQSAIWRPVKRAYWINVILALMGGEEGRHRRSIKSVRDLHDLIGSG